MSDTTHEAPKLLPCPFCGSLPDAGWFTGDYDICCDNCKFSISEHIVDYEGSEGQAKPAAVMRWNTRADLVQAAVAERDELKAAIDSEHSEHGNIWRFWRDMANKAIANRKATEAKLAQQDDLVQAAVAAALREALKIADRMDGPDEYFAKLNWLHVKRMVAVARKNILALIPEDAQAALDRARAAERERGFWAGRSCGGSKAEIDAALAAIREGGE